MAGNTRNARRGMPSHNSATAQPCRTRSEIVLLSFAVSLSTIELSFDSELLNEFISLIGDEDFSSSISLSCIRIVKPCSDIFCILARLPNTG